MPWRVKRVLYCLICQCSPIKGVSKMTKTFGILLLLVGSSFLAFAQQPVPEIDPGAAASALILLSGALLVIRARRR